MNPVSSHMLQFSGARADWRKEKNRLRQELKDARADVSQTMSHEYSTSFHTRFDDSVSSMDVVNAFDDQLREQQRRVREAEEALRTHKENKPPRFAWLARLKSR